MGKSALISIAAFALLVPNAQGLLLEHVGGPQVIFTLSKGTLRIRASSTLKKIGAKPRLSQIWRRLKLSTRVREGAVRTELASSLQVVQAELGLVELRMETRLPRLLLGISRLSCGSGLLHCLAAFLRSTHE